MDRLIVERFFLPTLEREFELPEATSPERLRLLRRLPIRAEEAKIDLSSGDSVVVSIVDVGVDQSGTLRRAEFECEIDPLVRTCTCD
jgi:molecular chaperone DnaK (HSP70)